MAKVIYLDVETTGVNFGKDSIHQIAGLIEIDGEVIEEYNIKMKPYHFDLLPDDYVTPVGGITKEMMQDYTTQEQGFKQFGILVSKYVDRYVKTDKMFVAGYNCQSFDMSFVRQWFLRNGSSFFGSFFYSHSIDAMLLASYFLMNERDKLDNFKLETVAKYLGVSVEGEGYHDALSDIYVTRKIIQIVPTW